MKYNIAFFSILTALLIAGCQDVKPEFSNGEDISRPEIATFKAVDIFCDSAMLRGAYYPPQNSSAKAKGFYLSEQPITETDPGTQQVVELPESGEFSLMVHDLALGKRYYFRAYSVTDGRRSLGEEYSFFTDNLDFTPADAPQSVVVPFNFKSAVGVVELGSLGTNNLNGLDKGMFRVKELAIYCWRTDDQTYEQARSLEQRFPQSPFSEAVCNDFFANSTVEEILISGLEASTGYSYCATITVAIYRPYVDYIHVLPEVVGPVQTFTTPAVGLPSVTTSAATAITAKSATLHGTITDDAYDETIVFGFVFGTSDDTQILQGEMRHPADNHDASTGNFFINLSGLDYDTQYYYLSYATTRGGTSFSSTPVAFKTPLVTAPAVATGDATHLTTYSALLAGQVIDIGGDPDVVFGFYVGTDAPTLISPANRMLVSSRDASGNFTLKPDVLSNNTTYYYCAFVENATGEVQDNSGKSFATLLLTAPVLSVTPVNYAYSTTVNNTLSTNNVTMTSALVTCKFENGIDPSITAYGIVWGTSEGSLTQTVPAEDLDWESGTFTALITGLSHSSSYYFKPYATNGIGSATVAEVSSFRTAVYGGKQLWFDRDRSGYSFQRMIEGAADMVYYELDPIPVDATTYYVLDRNLGAIRPFTAANYTTQVSDVSTDILECVGYFYQWGLNVPSYSPYLLQSGSRYDLQATWVVNSNSEASGQIIPNGSTAIGPNPQLWPEDGLSWTGPEYTNYNAYQGNPCPAGYKLPDNTDVSAISGPSGLNVVTLAGLHPYMRLGRTSILNANGNFANANWSAFWLANAPSGVNGRVMRIPGADNMENDQNHSRYQGAAIRCIRKS